MTTALVAFDPTTTDSDTLDRLFEDTLAALEAHGPTGVHALCVVDTRRCGEPALSSDELLVDNLEDRGHEVLGRFTDRAAGRGFDVETRCCHGSPHEQLATHAAEIDADLIVGTGSRPNHRIRRRLDAIADDVRYIRGPLVA